MNKNFSITILTSNYLSFLHQSRSLEVGFKKIGYKKLNIVAVNKENLEKTYKECAGDIIISVGSWRDWPFIYSEPVNLGKKVFPWIVSDDKVLSYIEEINKSPVVFTTSEYCKRTFEKSGIKKTLIEIIPEGIDSDFWKPISKKEKNEFKKIFSLPKNDKKTILLTIGGDGTSKGAQEVLNALGKIPELDIFYLIKTMAFEDAFFEGLKEKELIKKLQLKNKTNHIMGHFSDEFIRFLFNIADIYIAPSRHEGFGLPHIQAMACGKPVITCMGTAAEETSMDGVTGFVVPSHPCIWNNAAGYAVEGVMADINSLANTIKKLVLNEELRLEMGKNARKHVVKNYESKKIAEMFLKKIKSKI